MPAISVILNAYNAERYVEQTIDSLLAQTFRDFELVCVDDGSTDGTLSVLRACAARDSRMKVIAQPNTGIPGAINRGVAESTAPIIARSDADDISLPTRLEKQYAFLMANPDYVLVGSRVVNIDPLGSALEISSHQTEHEAIDAELIKGVGYAIVQSTAMMRRDALARVGGYRAEFPGSEDLDLWLRLAEIGKLKNLPEPLVQYRRHLSSWTATRYRQQWSFKQQIVSEAYQRRGLTFPSDWTFPQHQLPPADQLLRSWAWKALAKGNSSIARKHAWASLKLKPTAANGWYALARSLVGR